MPRGCRRAVHALQVCRRPSFSSTQQRLARRASEERESVSSRVGDLQQANVLQSGFRKPSAPTCEPSGDPPGRLCKRRHRMNVNCQQEVRVQMLFRVWNEVRGSTDTVRRRPRRTFFSVSSPDEARHVIEYLKGSRRYEAFRTTVDDFGLEFLSDRGWREWYDRYGANVLGRSRNEERLVNCTRHRRSECLTAR